MPFVNYDIILCHNQDNQRLLLTYSDIYSLFKRLLNVGVVSSGAIHSLLETMYKDKWVKLPLNEKEYLDMTFCKSLEALTTHCSSADFSAEKSGKAALRTCIEGKTVKNIIGKGELVCGYR